MKEKSTNQNWAAFAATFLCLVCIFFLLCSRSLQPDVAQFANDGPLGQQSARAYDLPTGFFGIWNDHYWLGLFSGNYSPNFTGIMLWILGPLGFNKFSVPFSHVILGMCAALFFRQLGFRPWIWVVGGLAAALNSNFFSNACWGLPTRSLSLAATFLALTAIHSSFQSRAILKTLLAGVAVGLSIMEGGDNGAIFSLFVAGFAFVLGLRQPGPLAGNAVKGALRVAVIAVLAGIVAVQTLNVFVQTSFKGMAGMQMDTESKEQRWSWATQWSLPKVETLRVIIPGLFGYRMDAEAPTPEGGEYWGRVGQTPGWPENHHDQKWVRDSMASPRFSGAGEYAGILVVLIAVWAGVEAWRKQGKAFLPEERLLIRFWTVAAVIAVLFAWGRFAPFYRIIYALPYFSTIRNPMKFMHPFHLATMILFAYGLQGLARQYLEAAGGGSASVMDQFKTWWAKGAGFEKRWFWGCVSALGAGLFGFLLYSSMRKSVVAWMVDNGFGPTEAERAAQFSAGEVGLFLVLLAAGIALLALILSRALSGPRAKWAMIALGLFVVLDLGRANRPWIKYYNYKEKYATNPVLEIFRKDQHEHRVVAWPRQLRTTRETAIVGNVYDVEWLQHHFPYYNIQSLDMPQEPRMPEEKKAYLTHVGSNLARLWEMTNTRYLLGTTGGLVEGLNQQLDPVKKRFRIHTLFEFTQDPKTMFISAQPNTNGPYAVIELADPLPRAKLYANWQVSTNDLETLKTLASAEFDPWKTVVVGEPIGAPAAGSTNGTAGTVRITTYAPKRVALETDSPANTVLLLNDKIAPGWNVTVDGKSANLLRANFIMRGVQVPAGKHQVEFTFQPELTGLYVSSAGLGLGLLLCLALVALPIKRPVAPEPDSRKEVRSAR